MTNKDLFNGLNQIDDRIIEEAQNPVKVKKKNYRKFGKMTHSLTTIAALFAVAILGTEVVRLNNHVAELESGKQTSQSYDENRDENESKFVGIKSLDKLGEYTVASNYEAFYDSIKDVEKNFFIEDSKDEILENIVIEDSVPTDSASDKNMEAAGSTESNSNTEFSKTNVMTEGVDESDVVKTDGNYIYMVESGQISITDISKGEPGKEDYLIPKFESPSDTIEELYVNNGNLLLITEHYNDKEDKDETISYSYNIENPMKPQYIGKSRQDGYYDTSRKIGDTVYVFSYESSHAPDLSKKKALLEENLDKWVPKVNDKIIASECIYIEDETQYGTIISSFDVNDPETTIDAKYVMNGNDSVYVSGNAIYFYGTDWRKDRQITTISRMDYEDGVMQAGESTSVNGNIRDSFAINENKGYLYILATESDSLSDVNTLHVFDENMEQVGVINEIARGESIYAARFVGNYAYFITYKQIDPLFVADISDPTNPKLLGELEVSGFSEYLHMWDDTHVLGIGYGDSGRDSIKLTMFDVSDPCNPVEENYTLIEDYGHYCEGMRNYKAILADPKKNLIGLAADKYYLYSYDSKKGFELVEETSLDDENSSGYRGLYSDDDFYVAGNGEIKHFELD